MNTTTEQLTRRLKWCMTKVMAMLAVVLCCSACNSVYDDEGDCDPRYFVRYVFDMNMLRADAFATQVNSVDLYVFNAQTGEYVTHLTDKGEALASGNYRMPLDVAPGKYELIAWCGLADNEDHFTVPQSIAKPSDLICTLTRSHDDKGAFSKENLHALFHGSLSVNLPNEEGEHTVTVKLTKDTNYITLSLNHKAGPLDPEDYEVTMTDENGLMAHNNSLMADEIIEYRPWDLRSGTIDLLSETATYANEVDEDHKEAGFLIAELATARLMTDHDMRINIFNKKQGKVVFSIPLVQWALLLRSAHHADMDEQEYLDRQDEYNLMVFLDGDEGWMAMEIYINGWHIINQENEY